MQSIKKQQQSVLKKLLHKADSTVIGNKYGFKRIQKYAPFADRVPLQNYCDIQPSIRELKNGATCIYWPETIEKFCVSAGTSGKGKHLPISDERLQSDRRFMYKVITSYLRQRPNIFDVLGPQLSMPGSVEQHGNLYIGEISGFTAQNIPAWLRFFQVVDPQVLTKLSFQQKFDLLLEKALNTNLKVITAVPSWILTLFQQALEKTGEKSVAAIWPKLKLLVCGGVKLVHYRPFLEKLARGLSLDFIETYGASEGYIGFSDNLQQTDLRMVIDNGIFFECFPHPQSGSNTSVVQQPVPLWEVQKDIPYGLLLTTNAGLWRYKLNDIIEFTSLNPLRFVVEGRMGDILDDFGEALPILEAKEALKKAVDKAGNETGSFAISSVFKDERAIPYHRWFVHFLKPIGKEALKKVAQDLDNNLQNINRHYTIRRQSNALGSPEVKSISQSDINHWLKRNGKADAQGKLSKILPKNTKLF